MRYLIVLLLVGCGSSGGSGDDDQNTDQADNTVESTFLIDFSARTFTLQDYLPDYATLDNATIDKIVIFERGFGLAAVDTERFDYNPNTDQILYTITLDPAIETGSQSVKIGITDCEPKIVDVCVMPTEGFLNTSINPHIIGGCEEVTLQCEAVYTCTAFMLVNYNGFSLYYETENLKHASLECI